MSSESLSPEPFVLTSADLAASRREALRATFPEIFTEGGLIDWDRLRRSLGETVDGGKERFGLNWPGKAACFTNIQTPSRATLRPVRGESVNFDVTGNVIIEGDNLEVLKLLQKSYLGQVKMIYIDPPYNTGNDFIYPDNYAENLETYLRYTGQVDADGQKFSTNPETHGRFHSRWLNMMYPRLYLARNLLRDDGLIFISVDDGEVDNLRKLCDEIFGEENFVSVVIWQKGYGGGAKVKHVVGLHEYVLVVARSIDALGVLELPPDPAVLKYYKFRDSKYDVRGPFRTQPLATTSMDDRPNLKFPIHWKGEEIWPDKQWQWSADRVKAALANDELVITKRSERWVVDYKQYLKNEDGEERSAKPFSVLQGPYTQIGTDDVRVLGLDTAGFSFPKPVGLIERFLLYCDKDALVLDFFAGSGTTGQAVFNQNVKDGGSRRFILVQLPEPTDRTDYPTIADITKERVRRVIQKLDSAASGELALNTGAAEPDRGFKVFKLDTSNFLPWDGHAATDAESLRAQLELHVHHLVAGRQPEDLLFELLLKSGYPLTAPVETLTLAGCTVYSVAGGDLLLCLEPELSEDLLRAMADRQPTPARVVCLDAGFAGNDALKTNAVQTMKTRGVTKFQTV